MERAARGVTSHETWRSREATALTAFVLAAALTLGFAAAVPAGENLVKAGGTLTTVDADGAVTIDGHDYIVSPSARIIDWRGYSIPLEELLVPYRVYFEYTPAAEGNIISLIEETAG